MYAIVDIETTGGHASSNGITEICIYIFDGNTIVSHYETLINPCQSIPRYIQAMTGITDEMVEQAPVFEDVAEKIYELLHDKVFVAHNVNFDYSFIKHQLEYSGYALNTKKLCTVRLSRKLLPGYSSYSLGRLCDAMGIRIDHRHRAGGDAAATVQLFQQLLVKDKEDFIRKSLTRNSKENVLPPHVKKEDFDMLPYTPGVYYFHNEKGKVIYVGKAKNIRYRVNSHFSNNSNSRQKQNFLRHTYAISFEPCATELMAHILESTEIKKLWPAFNYSQKNAEKVYGIFMYEDQKGYHRLAIEKNKKYLKPVYTFHYLTEGHALLRQLNKNFHLCPKLNFLQKKDNNCQGIEEGHCEGACEGKEDIDTYNERVTKAMASLHAKDSFVIIEKGLGTSDRSCILMWNGQFYGMGYISDDTIITQPEDLKDKVIPYKENLYIRNLVNGYAARYPEKVTYLKIKTANLSTQNPLQAEILPAK